VGGSEVTTTDPRMRNRLAGLGGVHQCIGKCLPTTPANKGCAAQDQLRLNTDDLAFAWDLPGHIKYESRTDIQRVSP
jgi:hypothetical protein